MEKCYVCGNEIGTAGVCACPKITATNCWHCTQGFKLQYFPGHGWFHFLPDGGPDVKCINLEVMCKPGPDSGLEIG